jgi:predicted nucleic acid-binding protein
MIFVDASAMVKRYVRERHSTMVRRLLAAGPVAVSRLSEVEVPSALARLGREGRLSARGRDRALAAFVSDFSTWHVVELTTAVAALARRQLVRYELRTGDAIQLSSALWLRERLGESLAGLLAFDTRIVAAAEAEQLQAPRG